MDLWGELAQAFSGERRVTSTFSIHSLLELGANFSSGNGVVSLDLHICSLREMGTRTKSGKEQICIYKHITCQPLREEKAGRNTDGVNTSQPRSTKGRWAREGVSACFGALLPHHEQV